MATGSIEMSISRRVVTVPAGDLLWWCSIFAMILSVDWFVFILIRLAVCAT
jgi:hypothetical protein